MLIGNCHGEQESGQEGATSQAENRRQRAPIFLRNPVFSTWDKLLRRDGLIRSQVTNPRKDGDLGRLRLNFELSKVVEALIEDENVHCFRVCQREGRNVTPLSKLGEDVKLASEANVR